MFIRDKLALAKKLMEEKSVSLNEVDRRKQHADIENQQLVLENVRRKAKGEDPLKELKKEDEDALPAEADKTKPEDDAYLAGGGGGGGGETGPDSAGLPESDQTGGQAVNDGYLM